ncbi:MAG TPA: hypothetical protein VG319_06860 [Polyangia bacterium]|jgi:hypothetical protein|nr:hypothetical protein [Polyangia bacterium]
MIRKTTWLSTFSCAVILAAIGGCGSSSPATTGKGGSGGSNDGAAGSGGTGGATSDASGQAGSNDDAAAGSGGATAGSGGATAGSGGATAGSGGATAGAGGHAGTGGAGGTKADAGTDTGTDATPTPCVLGGTCPADFTCTMTRACRRNQEQFCFCDPNNKIACEACDTVDAGTDGGGADAGTDAGAGIPMCPANVMNRNTTCTTFNERCAVNACTNHRQEQCLCVMFGNMSRWFCNAAACQ